VEGGGEGAVVSSSSRNLLFIMAMREFAPTAGRLSILFSGKKKKKKEKKNRFPSVASLQSSFSVQCNSVHCGIEVVSIMFSHQQFPCFRAPWFVTGNSSSSRRRKTVEQLWREFFSDPSQWWDHRSEKVKGNQTLNGHLHLSTFCSCS
jgi:hypothetical protein